MKNNHTDIDLDDVTYAPIPEELIESRKASELKETQYYSKVRRLTWLTAALLPGLYLLSVISTVGYGGLGGIILLAVLIPLLIVAMFIIRLVLKPYFKAVLSKKTNHVLRSILVGIGTILFAGFVLLLLNNAFGPNRSVKNAVAEIPEIEAYFFRHKDEFEKKRVDDEDSDYCYISYPYKSEAFPIIGFVYDDKGVANTGYHGKYLYTYKLDDYWYIEIFLPNAN